MTCNTECTQFDLAMELLIDSGFDGIAKAVGVLMNTAMWGVSYTAPADSLTRSGSMRGRAYKISLSAMFRPFSGRGFLAAEKCDGVQIVSTKYLELWKKAIGECYE
jgi:hypothetical protein